MRKDLQVFDDGFEDITLTNFRKLSRFSYATSKKKTSRKESEQENIIDYTPAAVHRHTESSRNSLPKS